MGTYIISIHRWGPYGRVKYLNIPDGCLRAEILKYAGQSVLMCVRTSMFTLLKQTIKFHELVRIDLKIYMSRDIGLKFEKDLVGGCGEIDDLLGQHN